MTYMMRSIALARAFTYTLIDDTLHVKFRSSVVKSEFEVPLRDLDSKVENGVTSPLRSFGILMFICAAVLVFTSFRIRPYGSADEWLIGGGIALGLLGSWCIMPRNRLCYRTFFFSSHQPAVSVFWWQGDFPKVESFLHELNQRREESNQPVEPTRLARPE